MVLLLLKNVSSLWLFLGNYIQYIMGIGCLPTGATKNLTPQRHGDLLVAHKSCVSILLTTILAKQSCKTLLTETNLLSPLFQLTDDGKAYEFITSMCDVKPHLKNLYNNFSLEKVQEGMRK